MWLPWVIAVMSSDIQSRHLVATVSGTFNDLYSVWGSSVSNVYAVGYSGTILQYNGSAWGPMTSGTTGSCLRYGAVRPAMFMP